MVGLFVGPVILAVLFAIWREWLHDQVNEPLMMPKATLAYDSLGAPLDTPKK